jgi:CheY-like chemotaxis protein
MKDISILFLDDDKHRHKYVSKFIKRMKIYSDSINFNCSCYYSASQAIKILNKKTFDIIMLDHDLDIILNKSDKNIEEINSTTMKKI